jgi:hypothetical protein
MSILSPEDKKYLRKISRYLESYELSQGDIEIVELEYSYEVYKTSDINFDRVTNFYNNYSVEVPEGLIPIIKKILIAGERNQDKIDFPDYIDYGRIEIEIDSKNKEIRLIHYMVYTQASDGNSLEFTIEDNDIGIDVFNSIREESTDFESIMELRYNGSDGGGYMEDRFENGVPVTGTVEDWCERALSYNFGGWENDEGSQGFFLFNMRNNTAELHHTYNERKNITTTLFEEEFGK